MRLIKAGLLEQQKCLENHSYKDLGEATAEKLLCSYRQYLKQIFGTWESGAFASLG